MREKKNGGNAALSKVQKLKKRLSQSFGKLGKIFPSIRKLLVLWQALSLSVGPTSQFCPWPLLAAAWMDGYIERESEQKKERDNRK